MIIPNSRQIKELDALSIQKRGIRSLDLMEEVAEKVARFIAGTFENKDKDIVVFAGPGNNGGDGLAVARLLHKAGYHSVCAYLFNTNNSLSEDCRANAERLKDECAGLPFTEVVQQFEAPQLSGDTLIVDALFGIGINKPLDGGYAALVSFINSTHCTVLSMDLPSGLMCEDNSYNRPAAIVRATYTLTVGLPKLCLLLADNQPFFGKVRLLDIGLSDVVSQEGDYPYKLVSPEDIRGLLQPRPCFGHKGTFGNALLIAGRYGMAGAAVLAAQACLRAGAGKITVHTPTRNNDILQISVPEAVLDHDADDSIFTTPVDADRYQAAAIGPGLGRDKRTGLALIEQVSHTSVPLVIDADAINLLADHRGWISQVPQHSILTPHPGEMRRLGMCNSDSYSTLQEAVNMAGQLGTYIVLKGHYTALCTPGGHVWFNTTGNSGMATAGSGDVLTGIILALCAQHYSAQDACLLGVYLHGLAGDLAARALGEASVMASDIVGFLPKAFAALAGYDPHVRNLESDSYTGISLHSTEQII